MKFEINEENCIFCLTCQSVCPNQAIELIDTKVQINQNLCDGCGTCALSCPAQAIQAVAEKIPIKVEESELSPLQVAENQKKSQELPKHQEILPNIFNELKKTVFDGFVNSKVDSGFNKTLMLLAEGGGGAVDNTVEERNGDSKK